MVHKGENGSLAPTFWKMPQSHQQWKWVMNAWTNYLIITYHQCLYQPGKVWSIAANVLLPAGLKLTTSCVPKWCFSSLYYTNLCYLIYRYFIICINTFKSYLVVDHLISRVGKKKILICSENSKKKLMASKKTYMFKMGKKLN